MERQLSNQTQLLGVIWLLLILVNFHWSEKNTVIRPSYKRFKGGIAFFPLNIGDHVMIEDDCVIIAASIGSYVHIGKNCVISRRCILKDCCLILDGSVLAPDTVVPPFTVFGGTPATFMYELPESFQELQRQRSIGYYDSMQLKSTETKEVTA